MEVPERSHKNRKEIYEKQSYLIESRKKIDPTFMMKLSQKIKCSINLLNPLSIISVCCVIASNLGHFILSLIRVLSRVVDTSGIYVNEMHFSLKYYLQCNFVRYIHDVHHEKTRTHPSFGMTTTKTLRSVFLVMHVTCACVFQVQL